MIKKIVLMSILALFVSNCVFADECKTIHKSVRFYEKQVMENPSDVCSLYNLANEYLLKDKIQKGLNTYNKILKINPKEEKAYEYRAKIYIDFKNIELAYRERGRLIKNIPDSIWGNIDMSLIYQNISDFDNALKHVNKAIELTKGEDKWFYELRAWTLYDMGRYEEAIEDYKRYLESNDEYSFDAYRGISKCYEAMGDDEKAKENNLIYNEKLKNHKIDISLINRIKYDFFDFKAKFYVDKLY